MESEVLDIVNLISDKKRADALDKIDSIMFGRASKSIEDYKKIVANTLFDQPSETQEEE
jgi:hypothetical protein